MPMPYFGFISVIHINVDSKCNMVHLASYFGSAIN